MNKNFKINLEICGITSVSSIKIAAENNVKLLGFASNNLPGPNTCNDEENYNYNRSNIKNEEKSRSKKISDIFVINQYKSFNLEKDIYCKVLFENTNYDNNDKNRKLETENITIYIYSSEKWEETIELVDETSEYALTGAVLSQDRYAIEYATKKLENAAGNFYINDKPTGAVVGQQPFGGARGSGTNDKAGSILNLLRWVSPRTIKETFVPANDYKYPFLG